MTRDGNYDDAQLAAPNISGLNINGWVKNQKKNKRNLKHETYLSELGIDGNHLFNTTAESNTAENEIVYSLAIAANEQRFLLGTAKFLRLFDKAGNQQ